MAWSSKKKDSTVGSERENMEPKATIELAAALKVTSEPKI